MNSRLRQLLLGGICAPASLLTLAAAATAAPAEQILCDFGIIRDGNNPQTALTAGPNGVYYGTTDNGGATGNGTVFVLIPPSSGQSGWTEKIIHAFSGAPDGAQPSSGLLAGANGVLYGVTGGGGPNGAGVAFSLTPPAAGQGAWTETILYSFNGRGDGKAPFGTLVADPNGVLYGSTAGGGDTSGDGVAFSLTPPASGGGAWTQTVLHRFHGGNDGASPSDGLLRDPASGALYGMTSVGGLSGNGTVYRLTPPADGGPAWHKDTLYNFTGQADGGFPVGALVRDQHGVLYGPADSGGATGAGAIFSLTPPPQGGTGWTENVLYSFTGGADGGSPDSTLVLAPDGTLYGSSNGGGTAGSGTVFALTPPASGQTSWTEAVLASFNGPNGASPVGLGLDASGALIGTSFDGGTRGEGGGTVFSLTPPQSGGTSWTQTILHQFRALGRDAISPQGALLMGGSGTLFGTAGFGGTRNLGAVFALSPPAGNAAGWQKTLLHSFNGRDGSFPTGKLLQDRNGVLYGTTTLGGPQGVNGYGAVYALMPPASGQTSWTEKMLYAFKGVGSADGANPGSGLIADASGVLYGTTGSGGTATSGNSLGNGTVFELVPPAHGESAWTETVLYRFTGPDGATPEGALLADKSGTLYGTTYVGGSAGEGTVFSLSPPAGKGTGWTATVLHSFNASVGNDGAIPGAEQLVQDGAGALYGTTTQGGLNNDGAVFKLAPPAAGGTVWTETLVHSFTGADGTSPSVGLLAGHHGTLYGVTAQGGDLSACQSFFGTGCGTVFKLVPSAGGTSWTTRVLHVFEPAYGRDGSGPASALIRDRTGNLFGATAGGGFGNGGVVFELAP